MAIPCLNFIKVINKNKKQRKAVIVVNKFIPHTNNRYYATDKGIIYDTKLDKPVAISKHKRGWLRCHIWFDDGVRRTVAVHRLVAMALLGESELTVNHIDGNKENNSIENLEYSSLQEQNIHRSQVLYRGNQRHVRCLENNIVYHNASEAARMLNLPDYSHICHMCRHKNGVKSVYGYHFEYAD